MFKTLSRYAGKAAATAANTTTNVARSTPSYLGSVAKEFSTEWKKGYTEQQTINRKKEK